MPRRDFFQHFAALAARSGKAARMPERRISDHRDVMFLAPRRHRMLDSALIEMVENLVARDPSRRDAMRLFQIIDIEVADAP